MRVVFQEGRSIFLVLPSNFHGFPETTVARATIADIASKQLGSPVGAVNKSLAITKPHDGDNRRSVVTSCSYDRLGMRDTASRRQQSSPLKQREIQDAR